MVKMRLEGLDNLKNPNDLIGYQTRNLPACMTLSQPTTLPRDPVMLHAQVHLYSRERRRGISLSGAAQVDVSALFCR
jgi:hypothetical protein